MRVGIATLKVHRMPSMATTGDRRQWVHLPPQATRAWAMAPTAIALGLRPRDLAEAARIPERRSVADIMEERDVRNEGLPPGMVYVGQGHHSHRYPRHNASHPM